MFTYLRSEGLLIIVDLMLSDFNLMTNSSGIGTCPEFEAEE